MAVFSDSFIDTANRYCPIVIVIDPDVLKNDRRSRLFIL
jgi:hypothetical protein